MKCTECGNKGLEDTTTTHELRIGDHVVRGTVPAQVCPKCGESYVSADALERLELQVAADVAHSGQVNGDSFRFMRKALGYQAKELADMIDTPAETISRWETNARPVDRFAWVTLATMVIDRADERAPSTQEVLQAVKTPKPFPKAVKVA